MTKLVPVNNHLLIEPVKQDGFMATERETYQEIGVLVAGETPNFAVRIGDRVYFDAWLAKKYPKKGSRDEFYWVVKADDVSLVERHDENPANDGTPL